MSEKIQNAKHQAEVILAILTDTDTFTASADRLFFAREKFLYALDELATELEGDHQSTPSSELSERIAELTSIATDEMKHGLLRLAALEEALHSFIACLNQR